MTGNGENGALQSRKIGGGHSVLLTERKALTVSGAEDVVSFDEVNILIRTVAGLLSVDGEGLHILKLDTESGELSIAGKVNGLFYMEQNEKTSGDGRKLKRLFR